MNDKGKEVLVVEDDDMLRKVMLVQLRLAGIPARSGATGEEALQLIDECMPSLIILDVGLPNMNGFDLVEQLRLNPAARDLPLIVHTSLDLTAVQRLQMTLGPTKIVTKSMAYSDNLAKLVKELIGTCANE
jgi:CheY-like chemotaxis protein